MNKMETKKQNLYNEEIKERFITNNYQNIASQSTIRANFARMTPFENFYEKDLFSFNYNEFKDLLLGLNCSTPKGLDSIVSLISNYLIWTRIQNYHGNCVDITSLIFREDIRKNVSKLAFKGQYLRDEEELYNLVDFCVNKQDAVLFVLCYEGVRGYELEELANLRTQDCNFQNNTLTVSGFHREKDSKGNVIKRIPYERVITIDPRSMNVIKDATEETVYYKKNGMIDTACTAPLYKITKTDYVVRYTGNRKNIIQNTLDTQSINKRISKIANLYDKPMLQATTIFISGLMNFLRKLERQEGTLTIADFKAAHTRYGKAPEQYWDTKDLYEIFYN